MLAKKLAEETVITTATSDNNFNPKPIFIILKYQSNLK